MKLLKHADRKPTKAANSRGLLLCRREFARSLVNWYRRHKRDLPWRAADGMPDPYHVLLSELMLQQTQVSTVIPYFHRFLVRFPTIHDLALADEQDVLRLWQGLGYYSRARNLHKAVKLIVQNHDGIIPRETSLLLELPGIGRYTAGAIASLAYGVRAPIVDGNVQRVLCRIEAIRSDPREPALTGKLWALAEQLLPERNVADFNSAMMELGATICTPRSFSCERCPVAPLCMARKRGIAGSIPPTRRAPVKPLEKRDVLCICRAGKWAVEQRPADGRWASMWQFITRPSAEGTKALRRIGTVKHELSHRTYEFSIFLAEPRAIDATWLSLDEIQQLPLSRPQQRVLSLVRMHHAS